MDSNEKFTNMKEALLYAVYSGFWLFQLDEMDNSTWCAGKSSQLYAMYSQTVKEVNGTFTARYWWQPYINQTEQVSKEIAASQSVGMKK